MTNKKRVVTSYHNLTPELQAELKKAYPGGFTEHLMRIQKPSGDFFCAVVFETPEVTYLVKVDVKIDGNPHEDEEKYYYDDEVSDSGDNDDIADRGEDDNDE